MSLKSMSDAAQELGVDARTLQRWRKKGAPVRQGKKGARVVDVGKVRAWAASQGLDGGAGRPIGSLSDPTAVLGPRTQPPAPEAVLSSPADADRAAIEAEVRAELEQTFRDAGAELRESIARAELRKRDAEASRLELALAEHRGLLLPAADVERGLLERIHATKSRLLALGRKLAEVAPGKSADEVRQAVDEEVEACLRAFADDERPRPLALAAP